MAASSSVSSSAHEHICPYCSLPIRPPFNYHEGADSCQEAMRQLAPELKKLEQVRKILKHLLPGSAALTSANLWEFSKGITPAAAAQAHTDLCNLLEINK